MRFLFISTLEHVGWGGSEVLWANTARQLCLRGDEVVLLRRDWQPEPTAITELRRAGVTIPIIPYAYGASISERWHRWQRRFRRCSYQKLVLQQNTAIRPDLVVISQAGTYDGLEWIDACRDLGLRYAIVAQVASDAWWPKDDFLHGVRRGLDDATKCFFVSQANRELARTQLGSRLENSAVVWNPFNVPFDTAPTWPATDLPLRLACVGRLEPGSKGQDILFRVLAQPKWRQRPLTVSLYGRGAQEEILRNMAARLELRAVSFCGHTDDIAGIWRDHHGLVLPSRLEGMPLVGIEAMMCHRMCIFTDAGGNAELIEDGVSGFLAGGAAPGPLDDALERAWARRAEWREIGLRAGQRIRQIAPPDPGAAFAELLRETARG